MTVDVVNFGCRLNSYEGEVIRQKAEEAGLSGAIIFNSCAVTAEAERQVRQAIRRTRKENPNAKIIVTGCSAQVHPEMYTKMDEVDRVLGNQEKLEARFYVPPPVGGRLGGRRESGDLSTDAPTPTLPLRGRGKLSGLTALVTSGPTYEAIDPVRFIGNRSSGKQGHAIAKALANQGAEVTLVTGPTSLADPQGVQVKHVMSADQMLSACEKNLPADIAVCAAAVSDWKVKQAAKQKIKKNGKAPVLTLIENRDILAHIASHKKKRPRLVIGFAAETEKLKASAAAKRRDKKCDWIVANDVSGGKGFDRDENKVALVTRQKIEEWPLMSKDAVAEKLVEHIVVHMGRK